MNHFMDSFWCSFVSHWSCCWCSLGLSMTVVGKCWYHCNIVWLNHILVLIAATVWHIFCLWSTLASVSIIDLWNAECMLLQGAFVQMSVFVCVMPQTCTESISECVMMKQFSVQCHGCSACSYSVVYWYVVDISRKIFIFALLLFKWVICTSSVMPIIVLMPNSHIPTFWQCWLSNVDLSLSWIYPAVHKFIILKSPTQALS